METTEKRFVLKADGEQVGEYTTRRAAKSAEKRYPEQATEIVDREELERQVKEAIELEQRMDAELYADEVAREQMEALDREIYADLEETVQETEDGTEESPVAEEPKAITPTENEIWAAGRKLKKGEINQELHDAVVAGNMTLDAALAVAKAEGITEKAKKASGKKASGPRPTWEIVTLKEDGEVDEVLYEAITSKELLEVTGVEKDTGKSRKQIAELQGKPVRMTHSKSGKAYVSKPSKAKAEAK